MDDNVKEIFYELRLSDIDRFKRRDLVNKLEKIFKKVEGEKQGAYQERNLLVSALSKLFPAYIAYHPEDEEWEDDWRTIIFIDLPTGQVSWHIHDSEKGLFSHLQETRNDWDGHTTKEKYKRLKKLKAR